MGDIVARTARKIGCRKLDVFQKACNNIKNSHEKSLVDYKAEWKFYIEHGVIPSWVTFYCNEVLKGSFVK